MNPFWLTDLLNSNATALWAVGIAATAGAIPLSRPLRHAPRCRSAVIGLAVMIFSAPVYGIVFDPWWQAPWPSIYITAALAVGDFKAASAYFHRQFWMPPCGWGIVAAIVWHVCSDTSVRRTDHGPPFA